MMAAMMLSAEQFPMKTETSPKSLRGLTHREIGDFTESFAVLMETPEPFIDKFVGPMTEALMLTGKDEFMQIAADRGSAVRRLQHHDRRDRSTIASGGTSAARRKSSSRWASSTRRRNWSSTGRPTPR